MSRTSITYGGGTPTITGTVTLFNSVTAFPPGGSFHLLGQQWLQYTLRIASDGGGATGTVVGSYSTDKGATWVPFYSKTTADGDDDDAAATTDVTTDEVYIGTFKDIRFQYTNASEAPTVFDVKLLLAVEKNTSKVTDGAGLTNRDPLTITGGAISAWLRLAHPGSAITGAGYSSVADVLAPSNPAVQTTDGRRPAPEAAANGLPCMRFATNDVLSWPLVAANNGTTRTGFAFWFKTDALGAFQNIIEINNGTGGASGHKLSLFIRNTGEVYADMYSNPVGTSGATGTGPVLSALTWYFITLEYDAGGATDALKLIITLGGAVQTLSFSAFGAGSLTTLPTVTGNALLCNRVNSGSPDLPFQGLIGPNFWVLGSKQDGATSGLLTSAARTALMNFDAPT